MVLANEVLKPFLKESTYMHTSVARRPGKKFTFVAYKEKINMLSLML